MKKSLLFTVFANFFLSCLMAQDGSNIRYAEPTDLDSAFIGKYCHIDFGRLSFRGQMIDTAEINVQDKWMKFYEHRQDNGYTNWFNEQYLIRIGDDPKSSTRLQHSKIDSLTRDRIYLTSTLSYYINESPIDTITVFQHSFDWKDVSRVLIKD